MRDAVRITQVSLRPYRLPLPAPVVTARTTRGERSGWLLRLQDDEGRTGWGEATCWPGFGAGPAATQRLLEAFVERPALLRERSFADVEAIAAWTDDWKRDLPEALSAAEVALLDLLAQRREVSLARLLHPHPATRVDVHRFVRDAGEARAAVAAGASALKLKLHGELEQALAHVAAVRAAAPEARLRLDVNGGWDRSTAADALARLARFHVEWVEQPLPAEDVLGLARLRARSPIRIAVDETLAVRDGLARVLEAEAADVVVLKPVALGGLLAARRLAREAAAAGLGVCVTHCFGAGVERTAGLHLAAALPGVEACGLLPPERELVATTLISRDTLRVPRGAGLGVSPRGLALAGGTP